MVVYLKKLYELILENMGTNIIGKGYKCIMYTRSYIDYYGNNIFFFVC